MIVETVQLKTPCRNYFKDSKNNKTNSWNSGILLSLLWRDLYQMNIAEIFLEDYIYEMCDF